MTRRPLDVVEAIVRPRRVLRGLGAAVHLPGSLVGLPEDEFDALSAAGTVRIATPEVVAEVRDAIARRLPVEGYSAPNGHDDEPAQDPADPDSVSRRRATQIRRRNSGGAPPLFQAG